MMLPPPVTEVRPELPLHLARVIRRCLEKDPGDRYQTARDVLNELRALKLEVTSGFGRSSASGVEPRTAIGRRPFIRKAALVSVGVMIAAADRDFKRPKKPIGSPAMMVSASASSTSGRFERTSTFSNEAARRNPK